MKTGHHVDLEPEEEAQLQALREMDDDRIDLSDRAEKLDWSHARRGLFRPVKQQLTVRFDADVVGWFRQQQGDKRGYQTRMNAVLRAYMLAHVSEGR